MPVSTTSRWPWSTRRRTSPSTAAALRLRESPRTSGITQYPHENEQPSWIFTNARTRSSLAPADTADRADVAGDETGRLLGTPRDDRHVRRQLGEPVAAETRSASRDVHAGMGPGGTGSGLAALGKRLVRDAAAADHGDVRRQLRSDSLVAVGEQPLADLVRINVRDLAAEKLNAEARHVRDRTAVRRGRARRRPTRRAPAARRDESRRAQAPRRRGSRT